MKGFTLTKVWQVDYKLVVADTIAEAVELYKAFRGEDFHDEPLKVTAITSTNLLGDRDAVIKEGKK